MIYFSAFFYLQDVKSANGATLVGVVTLGRTCTPLRSSSYYTCGCRGWGLSSSAGWIALFLQAWPKCALAGLWTKCWPPENYPYNWLLVRCRSSAGQGKFAGQKPTFYHCATIPTVNIHLLFTRKW